MSSPIHASIEVRSGQPTLCLQDQPELPLLYGLTDSPGSRWTWEEVPTRNIRLFADQGVRLFQFDLWLDQLLDAAGNLDIALARKQVRGVLEAAPESAVMIRFHVTAPAWWCENNPEECVGYADAEPLPESPFGLTRPVARDLERPMRASFFSSRWKKEGRDYLGEFCQKLAATKEGAAVFSIQIANGTYGEWHQYGFLNFEPDTGPVATRQFRNYFKNRYGDLKSLNASWKTHFPDEDSILPPTLAQRKGRREDGLLDPETQRQVIDYYQWTQETIADLILDWGQCVKEHWPRPVITAAFFGYFFSAFGRMAQCGHLAFEKLLQSSAIDALCAPQSYREAARSMGGTGQTRGLTGPVVRAGKLWLDEMDESTCLGGCPWFPEASTQAVEEDAVKLRRNVLHPFTRGGGLWYYDFGPNTATVEFPTYGVRGAWDDPTLAAETKRLVDLMRQYGKKPTSRLADVLVVHDPMSLCHLSTPPIPQREMTGAYIYGKGDPVTLHGIDELSEGLHRSGLIHEEALLSEIPQIDLTQYKLLIFATTLVISPEQHALLQRPLEGFAGHIIFTGFTGWSNGVNAGLPQLYSFTGFEVERSQTQPRLQFHGFGLRKSIEVEKDFPHLSPQGPGTVLATWENGDPAALLRKTERGVRSYFAVPPGDSEILHALGKETGCHAWNAPGDTTLQGRGLLIIHSKEGGKRAIQLPNGKSIDLDLPAPTTTVLDSETGEVLLP